MASIGTNEQTLVGDMTSLFQIYGSSGEGAQCEPILAALGSKAVSDSIAMAGASGATASMLINQEGEDFAKFGATLQADLMMTSGVPTASDTAINNELMSLLGGASSQMAPVDPNAEAKIFMAMGQGDDYDPFDSSACLTPPGTPAPPGTPGACTSEPYGTGSTGGSWEVDPGLGQFDPFALPDAPSTPWPPTPPTTPPPPAPSACASAAASP